MIRRFTVLILFLSLSSPSLAATAADGVCMTAKAASTGKAPAGSAHACCATVEAPDTCATSHAGVATDTCSAGTLAMSCCSVDTAPYRHYGSGALPPYAPVQPDQPDFATPLRGFEEALPLVHVSRTASESDTSRSPPPLRALFCTYLI